MKVLLTFTGFHDPFSDTAIAGEKETGPVLTVASERQFDRVYLFATPNTAEVSAQTKKELERRHEGMTVEICEVPLKDPTNYFGILKQLRTHFKTIDKQNPDADFFICVSSGTPHMHASWLMLAASGEIPAKILQTRASRFVTDAKDRVTEIDFTNPQFPQIKSFKALPEEGEDQSFLSVCANLGIVGENEAFLKELKKAHTFAEYTSPVLLLGETGAGKEVFARLIHKASSRSDKPFIPVNCAAISETLVESQLFGHRKVAFSGADRDHKGFFEEADGGTLFLDELGEIPTRMQAKLLRVIQEGKIQKIGESKERAVDVRVVAATNIDIKQAIKEKKLRQDLFYRFEGTVSIPALRQRRSDIPRLAHHFIECWNRKHQKPKRLSQEAILALMKHSWPGNVRELEGLLNRSAQLTKGSVIGPEDLIWAGEMEESGLGMLPEPEEGFNLPNYVEDVRGRLVERAVEKSGGNASKAAALLGVTPQAVSQALKKRK